MKESRKEEDAMKYNKEKQRIKQKDIKKNIYKKRAWAIDTMEKIHSYTHENESRDKQKSTDERWITVVGRRRHKQEKQDQTHSYGENEYMNAKTQYRKTVTCV